MTKPRNVSPKVKNLHYLHLMIKGVEKRIFKINHGSKS